MRIIKRAALVRFWSEHPDAKTSLEAWYGVVRKAKWTTPIELKQVYGNADLVGRRTVFNIAGNKYRIVVWINYPYRVLYIRFIGTHREYDAIDAQSI